MRREPAQPPLPPRPPWLEALHRFVERHGWRAYALPVLVVVTIAGLATLGSGSGHTDTVARTPAAAGGSTTNSSTAGSIAPAPAASNSVRVEASNPDAAEPVADQLPAGAAYTQQGRGTFTVIPGSTAVIGSGPVKHYVIEAEDGITGTDLSAFAAAVVTTLDDPRSWTGGPKNVSLERVSSDAQADFRIALTTPLTVRPICGYDIKVETSCWDDQHGPSRVYLNLARWVRGDVLFAQDIATYHLYMVNHEVGHALGHVHTFTCLPNGSAPVMMQQTLTLTENQGTGPRTCTPNAWPYPPGIDPTVAVPS